MPYAPPGPAIVVEVAAASPLRLSEGFSRPGRSVPVAGGSVVGFAIAVAGVVIPGSGGVSRT